MINLDNDPTHQVKMILNRWLFSSIDRAISATTNTTDSEGSPLIVYLLISCVIDIIAGFHSGRKPNSRDRRTGVEYQQFLESYLPAYDSYLIYKGLRCAMAHNFTIDSSLALTHGHPELHTKFTTDNKLTINLEDFYSEVKNAIRKYFDDLSVDPELQKKFRQRFSDGGIIYSTGADYKIPQP